jgi:hypothetical protein
LFRTANDEWFDQSAGRLVFDQVDFDSNIAKARNATGGLWIRITMPDDDPRWTRLDDGIGTWSGSSLMRTWFKCDVEGATTHAISGNGKREYFRMRATECSVVVCGDECST